MKITEEMLIAIYKRAKEAAIAKYGRREPDEIHIEYDSIRCVWGETCRGAYYEDEEYLGVEDLTENLDELYRVRRKKEQQDRLKQQEENDKRRIAQDKMDKDRRKADYLKLKKEFE